MFVSVESTCLYQSESRCHIQIGETLAVPEDCGIPGNSELFLEKKRKTD